MPEKRIKRIPREHPLIPLTEIVGIDLKTVEALKSKGIEDVLTLARQSTSFLASELGVSLEKAQGLIMEARLRMERT